MITHIRPLQDRHNELLHQVKEEHPDLVVLDLGMPGREAVETLERVRAMNP